MSTRSVVFINDARTWRGGERQTLDLATGLLGRGHRVRLIAPPHSPLARRAEAAAVPVDAVPMPTEIDPVATARIGALLREHEPAIVHAHTAHAHTLGLLASRLTGVGRLVVSRRVDFPVGRSKSWLSERKYRQADRFVAVSHRVRVVLVDGGVDPERIAVVHSGVDPDRVRGGDGSRFRQALSVPPSAPLVGCVAALADHKSLPTLLAAVPALLEQVPHAWLVVLGEGEERPRLEAIRAESSARERILLPGFRDDLADAFDAFDAFAMPSHLEGLCTSILDAFAAGVPVVCSDAGGMPELVAPGRTGLLVPPREPAALASALVQVLTDSALATALTDGARERLLEQFTIDAMVEGTLAVYEEVLGARSTGRPGRARPG